MYEYNAKIIRVVDGDSINVEVDLGFNIRYEMPLRLFGINAPEMSTDKGKAVKALVQGKLPVGLQVVIKTVKDRKEKYGRYLATVLIPNASGEPPLNLNTWLVTNGYADLYVEK